jgi:hypothetical protein
MTRTSEEFKVKLDCGMAKYQLTKHSKSFEMKREGRN